MCGMAKTTLGMHGVIGRVTGALLLALGALVFGGCENGGSDFDFGSNNSNVVACVGDSITAGGYPQYLGGLTGKTVLDLGVGGAHADDVLGQTYGALSRKPGYLCVMAGANDAIHGHDMNVVENTLRTICRAARANNTLPVIATTPPMFFGHAQFEGNVEDLNQRIRRLAPEEGASLVDVFDAFDMNATLMLPDGLHPNPAGDELIAHAFAGAID